MATSGFFVFMAERAEQAGFGLAHLNGNVVYTANVFPTNVVIFANQVRGCFLCVHQDGENGLRDFITQL